MSVVEPLVARVRADSPERVARAIVEVARWAPSVHNTQPWTWRMRHHDLELRADRSRQLEVSDPQGRNLTISCGAALHYTVTAAQALGWDTDVELIPASGDPDLMAVVRLAPGDVPRDSHETLDLLRRRCTDRRRFTNWPIPASRLRQLAETVRLPGVDVAALSEPVIRWRVEALISRAMDAQSANRMLVDEQRRWIDHGHQAGIPGPALADVPTRSSNLHRWSTRFDEPAPAPAVEPVESTDGLLAIGTTTDDAAAWLRAGTAVTGLWLRATAEGLSVVPLSQVIEVPETRAAVLEDVFGGGRWPQLLLRIGWQEIGRSGLERTRRRALDDLLER